MIDDSTHEFHGLVADCPSCDDYLIEDFRSVHGDDLALGVECLVCGHSERFKTDSGGPVDEIEGSEHLDNRRIERILWIDCQRCHGAGDVEKWGIRSGRERCPECHGSGTEPRLPEVDRNE